MVRKKIVLLWPTSQRPAGILSWDTRSGSQCWEHPLSTQQAWDAQAHSSTFVVWPNGSKWRWIASSLGGLSLRKWHWVSHTSPTTHIWAYRPSSPCGLSHGHLPMIDSAGMPFAAVAELLFYVQVEAEGRRIKKKEPEATEKHTERKRRYGKPSHLPVSWRDIIFRSRTNRPIFPRAFKLRGLDDILLRGKDFLRSGRDYWLFGKCPVTSVEQISLSMPRSSSIYVCVLVCSFINVLGLLCSILCYVPILSNLHSLRKLSLKDEMAGLR